jgi:hypothetical protein
MLAESHNVSQAGRVNQADLRYDSYVQPSTRQAKDFLIDQILLEADREGVYLSTVERGMLEYSETENTPPNLGELNAEFDRDYDQREYEEKIASLIRNLLTNAGSKTELGRWERAVHALSNEDHYLLVMIAATRSLRKSGRPRYDHVKLIATAVIAIAFALMFFLQSLGFDLSRRH